MIVEQKPQVVTTTRSVCQFHQDNPGKQYAGCTCSGGYSTGDKTYDEYTEEELREVYGLGGIGR